MAVSTKRDQGPRADPSHTSGRKVADLLGMLPIAKKSAQSGGACRLAQFCGETLVSHVREMVASAATCSIWAAIGMRRRKTRSTGLSSTESNWIGRLRRANIPKKRSSPSIRACGRAKPSPSRVDPSCSRARKALKTIFGSRLRQAAARGESEKQLLLIVGAGAENYAAGNDKVCEIHGDPVARTSKLT